MVHLTDVDLLKLTKYSMELALFYNDRITDKTLSQRAVGFVQFDNNNKYKPKLIQLGVETSNEEVEKLVNDINELRKNEKSYARLRRNVNNFIIMELVDKEQARRMKEISEGNYYNMVNSEVLSNNM